MGYTGVNMTLKQHVDHWISSSDQSLLDMSAALKSGRRMNAMYCGHLAIEKIFKALLASRDTRIEWTHNLVKLAQLCNMTLSPEHLDELNAINRFNIAARYASAKSQVYALCTKQYTAEWAAIIRKWRKRLKEQVLLERAALPNNKAASYPETKF